MLQCRRSLGIASAGPIPISRGSHPAICVATSRPKGCSPNSYAAERRERSIKDAPSVICELFVSQVRFCPVSYEFPAVLLPSFLKTGCSFAKLSRVALGRIPSSLSIITATPESSFVWTGTISASYRPSDWALYAR